MFMTGSTEVLERAARYAQRHFCHLEAQLGYGFDGIVFSTDCQSAVKVFKYERQYTSERDAYFRLRELRVYDVRGFAVPRLLQYDDELWVVEMTIVRPPFVLDFAGASLDRPHEFPKEVLEAWRLEKAEQFETRWPEVRRLIGAFEQYGIYLSDVKPGNIEFG
jgi:hypothetical protein